MAMFVATIFIVAKEWNFPTWPSTDEWVKEIQNGTLFNCKEKQNHGICKKIDVVEDYNTK